MMKKLIIFFCGTLALTACGNGIEKKANEKLTIARAAYERGDYEEAKTQIDSIKILYPIFKPKLLSLIIIFILINT